MVQGNSFEVMTCHCRYKTPIKILSSIVICHNYFLFDTSHELKTPLTTMRLAIDEIPKIFDQFYRVEKSRSIKHGRSGLGLAIVKRIVELHGGNVKLESEKGSWPSVMVFLPVTGNNVKK